MVSLAATICRLSASLGNDFEENLNTFSHFLYRIGRSDGTIRTYVRMVGLVAREMESDPAGWSFADCDGLILSDWWGGLKLDTQKTVKFALKSYWEVLRRSDILGPDNLTFWKMASSPKGKNRFDDLKKRSTPQEDVDIIIETCRETITETKNPNEIFRHAVLHHIAAYGIRCEGLRNMRVCDIDPETDTIVIHKTKGSRSREFYADIPIKDVHLGYLAARTKIINNLIGLHSDVPETVALLEDLRDNPKALLFFKRGGNNGARGPGERLSRTGIQSIVKLLTHQILGRPVNPHSFRHSKVFYLLDGSKSFTGLAIEKVAKYIGHIQIQTTMQYYHPGAKELKESFREAERANNGGDHRTPRGSHHVVPPTITFDDKVAQLKALHDQRVLNDAAFGAAVAELLRGAD